MLIQRPKMIVCLDCCAPKTLRQQTFTRELNARISRLAALTSCVSTVVCFYVDRSIDGYLIADKQGKDLKSVIEVDLLCGDAAM
jgi:hypothetical protein